jgi:hypothetical protein
MAFFGDSLVQLCRRLNDPFQSVDAVRAAMMIAIPRPEVNLDSEVYRGQGTPLLWLTEYDFAGPELVEALVRSGRVDLHARDSKWRNVLHCAAAGRAIRKAETLFKLVPAEDTLKLLAGRTQSGNTPLRLAAATGQEDMVRLFVRNGASTVELCDRFTIGLRVVDDRMLSLVRGLRAKQALNEWRYALVKAKQRTGLPGRQCLSASAPETATSLECSTPSPQDSPSTETTPTPLP